MKTNEVRVEIGKYIGALYHETDEVIYLQKQGCPSVVHEDLYYNRKTRHLENTEWEDGLCVAEYPDGEYVNFWSLNINGKSELVWGIRSVNDTSDFECSFWTDNDLELIYHYDTHDYSFDIETPCWTNDKQEEKDYLVSLLQRFTDWMRTQGYNTDYHLDSSDVFYKGIKMKKHSKTIEEVYAKFKLLVLGYCM